MLLRLGRELTPTFNPLKDWSRNRRVNKDKAKGARQSTTAPSSSKQSVYTLVSSMLKNSAEEGRLFSLLTKKSGLRL